VSSGSGVEHSRLLVIFGLSRRPELYYHSGTETDPVSDMLCFLEYWTIERSKKNSVIQGIFGIYYLLFQQVLSFS
jgi:hypothetical protein